METKPRIIIIDDEADFVSNFRNIMEDRGYDVEAAYNGKNGIALCHEKKIDVAFVDIKLPDMSGNDVALKITELSPGTDCILITAHASLESAVNAVKQKGVVAYELKPLDIDHVVALINEILKRKRAEEALAESERRYREMAELMPDMIYELDKSLNVTYANRAAFDILGYTEDELVSGISLSELIVHEDMERAKAALHKRVKGIFDGPEEYKVYKKDGSQIVCEGTSGAIRNDNGTIVGFRGVIRDITGRKRTEEEKKKLEEQLRHTQKMDAIGTLARGIAHDFNNILGVIVGYTEMMEMFDMPDDSPMQERARHVLEAADRAKELVQQILTFSRQTESALKPVLLNPIGKEVLKFLRASLPATVEFRMHMENNIGAVLADPTQIHQVLMNLCTNAAHAMEETGGVLDVTLAEVDLDAWNGDCPFELAPGQYIRLTVSDTGHGMDAETIERIFDPYFTTKKPGQGTGLGLAVVHGIVKSHGGGIFVRSEIGKGSVFEVFFPRHEMGPAKPKDDLSSSLSMGDERILFVDDEEDLVHIGKEMLTRLGYEVTVRRSSLEALELFRTRSDAFDLVITDQTMPNMTGVHLAREFSRIKPGIPIILCSGFSETTSVEKAHVQDIHEFLNKPLSIRDLARTVRKVLDSAQM